MRKVVKDGVTLHRSSKPPVRHGFVQVVCTLTQMPFRLYLDATLPIPSPCLSRSEDVRGDTCQMRSSRSPARGKSRTGGGVGSCPPPSPNSRIIAVASTTSLRATRAAKARFGMCRLRSRKDAAAACGEWAGWDERWRGAALSDCERRRRGRAWRRTMRTP